MTHSQPCLIFFLANFSSSTHRKPLLLHIVRLTSARKAYTSLVCTMPTTRSMTRALAHRTIFDILPTEIIYNILDNMFPHEYSGFSCASRQALAVNNAKLQPELSGAYAGYATIRTHYVSITGRFAYVFRPREIEAEDICEAGGCNGRYCPTWDDPDL